jgi:hypothetical protein
MGMLLPPSSSRQAHPPSLTRQRSSVNHARSCSWRWMLSVLISSANSEFNEPDSDHPWSRSRH